VQGCLTSFRRFSRFTLALTYRQNLKIQRVLLGSALKLRDLLFSASPTYRARSLLVSLQPNGKDSYCLEWNSLGTVVVHGVGVLLHNKDLAQQFLNQIMGLQSKDILVLWNFWKIDGNFYLQHFKKESRDAKGSRVCLNPLLSCLKPLRLRIKIEFCLGFKTSPSIKSTRFFIPRLMSSQQPYERDPRSGQSRYVNSAALFSTILQIDSINPLK
jgi:hypothetical protein